MTIIDMGAGDAPDPRADATVDLFTDADYQFNLGEEWELDENTAEGLIFNHVAEHLDVAHLFREAARVLVSGGWLELTMPVGRDARADPDHEHQWTFWTPKMYCRRHRETAGRPWDTETAFELVSRDVSVWLLGPFAPLSGVFDRLAQRWPHWGVRRCGAGELTARYRRVDE